VNPIRLLILRLRAILWTAFAMSCIALAVMVGLASLMLPYAERFRPEIETLMAERLGRQVQLQSVEARWTVTGPQLTLHGLGIGAVDQPESLLWVDLATVGYDLYGWLRPGRSGLSYFRLMSDHLELIRHSDGHWSLAGLGAAGSDGAGENALEWVLEQGGISVSTREFLLLDEVNQQNLWLENAQLDFSNHGDHQRLSARVSSPNGVGQITLESQTRLDDAGQREIDAYVRGEGLDLSAWFEGFPLAGADLIEGQASFEIWADIRPSGLVMRGEIDAESLILGGHQGLPDGSARIATRYGADSLRSAFHLGFQSSQSWQLELRDFRMSRSGKLWPESALAVARRPDGEQTFYDLAGEFLRLQDLAAALVVFEILPEPLRRTLFDLAPYGDVSDMQITDLRVGWPLQAQGRLAVDGLSISPMGRAPGLTNFAGQLELNGESGVFKADASDAFFSLPGILRWPVPLDRVAGVASWHQVGGQWRLDVQDISLHNQGVDATGRFSMLIGDGSRPFIDLMAHVTRGDVAEATRYWPVNIFKPNLVSWLDQALVGGTVQSGTVILYGDMDDWPFDQQQGRFDARADVQGAVLDFHPDWPRMHDIKSILHFDAQGMSAESPGAVIGDLPIAHIEADLPKFRYPRLALKAEGSAPGGELLAFLQETPINDTHGRHLQGLDIQGRGDVWLNLELPFGKGPGEREVMGYLWLEDNLISDTKWGVNFDHTRGRLDFSDDGLEALDLDTEYQGFPAKLSFWTGDFVDDPAAAAQGRLVGVAPAAAILKEFPVLQPVLDRIPGACVWEAELIVGHDGGIRMGAGEVAPRLVLKSELIGTAMNLPAPFDKPEGLPVPLTVTTDLPNLANDLSIRLGEIVSLAVHQDPGDGRWSGNVHFGPGENTESYREGLSVDGHIEKLDLDQWREVVFELMDVGVPAGDEQHWISGIDLTIDSIALAGREFTNLHVVAERDPDYWNLNLSGDQMEGTLRLPVSPDPNRLMLAEFERLQWPSVEQDMPVAGLIPGNIPPLRFFAKDLTFLDIPVGTTSFETYPTVDGMHIDQLETASEVLSISASGDWVSNDEGEESRFAGTVTGEDFGQILDAFGFSGMVKGGQTVIKLDATWPSAPSGFELAILGGDLDISIGRGQITELQPGAGRIFGLLSLTQIPRRLRLDFADLFKSGMTFDNIEGKFLLDSGDAYTDNLLIASPTAEVAIRGRTGLAQQDYNQIITVTPKVSETLPLVGALAAGGAGAAALLVFQGIFGDQIARITRYHYAVTGSWEEPTVELLGANNGQVALEVPTTRPEG
jgi:uncharacterized protein (TIGR02099 family)